VAQTIQSTIPNTIPNTKVAKRNFNLQTLSGLGALLMALALIASDAQAAAVNWAQPPVACVEDVVPSVPSKKCLDLSGVANPMGDLPSNLPPAEAQYWSLHRKQLLYCRGKEVVRRERANPGSQGAEALEDAWMMITAVKNYDTKVNALYEASRAYHVPVQVLAGAVMQESLFSELGISEDGGNYSCGVGQLNINEWCLWAASSEGRVKKGSRWPSNASECSLVEPSLIRPFYEIAKTRLNGLPEYRLRDYHFENIKYGDVVDSFPSASYSTQKKRFDLVTSFIENCSDARGGIMAKAHELEILYNEFIPSGLKQHDVYKPGEKFERTCRQRGEESYYPLHLGWLLAVGTYNAGTRAVDALAYYNRWSAADMKYSALFDGFNVVDMVSSLYWSGRYSSVTDKIHFLKLDGEETSWNWFKPCVLQRHIARVVQHVTLPGTPKLVDTLEGQYHCAKSVFDPQTGALVRSGVPEFRQVSSGRKPNRGKGF
jgi:hypothetical protein